MNLDFDKNNNGSQGWAVNNRVTGIFKMDRDIQIHRMLSLNAAFLLTCACLFLCVYTPNAQASSWWADDEYNHGTSLRPVGQLAQGVLDGDVLFVDTREPEEFQEGHIPNAINIRLVDIDHADLTLLKRYQYVVPYCLKDFRGFEVARALREKGLENVVMMDPSGLRGWQKLGLPTTQHTGNVIAMLRDALKKHKSSKGLAAK